MSFISRKTSLFLPGHSQGFLPRYNTSTSIKIGAGNYEVDGDLFSLAAEATHTFTGLTSTFTHLYVYLDKSESSQSVPVFRSTHGTADEPVKDAARNGWYSSVDTEDRLIISIPSRPSFPQISYFNAVEEKGSILITFGLSISPVMAQTMNPDGAWQTPNISDGDVVTPVNADKIMIALRGAKIGGYPLIAATTAERATVITALILGEISLQGFDTLPVNGWLILGASRKIKIGGNNSDNNSMGCQVMGNRQGR